MKEKILNKEGLKKLLEKLKERFAPLDSPKFRGEPTVETPWDGTLHSKGKEIVNKAYVSKYVQVSQDAFMREMNQHVSQIIMPSDWTFKDDKYVNGKYSSILGLIIKQGTDFSVSVRLDTPKLDSKHFLEAYHKHPLGLTIDGEVFTVGEKPSFALPIVIDLFCSNKGIFI